MLFAAVVGIVAVKALSINRLQQGSTRCDVTRHGSTRWKLLNPGGLAKTAESGSGPGSLPKILFVSLLFSIQGFPRLLNRVEPGGSDSYKIDYNRTPKIAWRAEAL